MFKLTPDEYFLVDNSGLKRQGKCRLWDYFRSVNHRHLGKKGYVTPWNLWFGSMIHKALEELEGRDAFGGDVRATVEAWYNSFRNGKDLYDEDGNIDLTKAKKFEDEKYLPEDSSLDDVELAITMIENYFEFLESRNIKWETVLIDGKPAVEVPFYVKLDIETPDGKPVVMRGTVDRIVKDGFDNYYFVDYKTRSRFTTETLSMDPQILNYLSIGAAAFPFDIKGMYFVQLKKKAPKPVRILKDGSISTAKSQATTIGIFEKALIDYYGSLDLVPKKYDGVRHALESSEHEMHNDFFHIQEVGLPEKAKGNCIENIYLQVETMIDEDYKIFPTAGDHCTYCPYRDLCQVKLIGGDYEEIIEREYEVRKDRYNEEPSKQEKRYEKAAKKALNII